MCGSFGDPLVILPVRAVVSGAVPRGPDLPKTLVAWLAPFVTQCADKITNALCDLHRIDGFVKADVIGVISEMHLSDARGAVTGLL